MKPDVIIELVDGHIIEWHCTDDDPHMGICMICAERLLLYKFNGAWFCKECLNKGE